MVFRHIPSVVGYRRTTRVVGYRKRTTLVASDQQQQTWVTVVGFRNNRERPRLPNFRRRTIVMTITLKTSGEVQVENDFRWRARVVGFN